MIGNTKLCIVFGEITDNAMRKYSVEFKELLYLPEVVLASQGVLQKKKL